METRRSETDSHEVPRPSSALVSGSDLHRVYLSRLCSTLRLSQPLSALLRPAPSRPCFMPAALMGFVPSEVSPRRNPLRLSTPAPLLTLPPGSSIASHGKPLSAIPFPLGGLQGFSPPASPFSHGRCYPPAGAVPLLGLVPSKGLPDYAMGTPSRTFLSHTSTPARLTRRLDSPLPGAPESHSTQPVACLSTIPKDNLETAVLPGVYSLVTPHNL
jgi:hypothetical protein